MFPRRVRHQSKDSRYFSSFNIYYIFFPVSKNKETNMKFAWKRLIRFEAVDGRILRGEPVLPMDKEIDLGFVTEADQLQARILDGDDIYDTSGKTVLTEQVVQVKRILSPLAQSDVPILRCIGLNYAKHSEQC